MFEQVSGMRSCRGRAPKLFAFRDDGPLRPQRTHIAAARPCRADRRYGPHEAQARHDADSRARATQHVDAADPPTRTRPEMNEARKG